MKSIKVLRSACMVAVACGVLVTVEAMAQPRDKPAASQARKADAKQQQRKQVQARHGKKKHKPVAANKSGAKAKNAVKRPPATAAKKKSPVAAAAATKRPARNAVPPAVAWVPPPLGPERFYPNGIPELRPEFLYPEGPPTPLPPQQAASARTESVGHQPEWLP